MHRLFINANRVVAVVIVCIAVIANTALASASTKPSGDLVPRGALVMTLTGLPTVGVGAAARTITVTRASVIAKVRSLVNALPVTSTANTMCPDDMLVPSTLSFKKTLSSAPFTKVVFQLGGCPSARVYQLGVAVSPTLGGAQLSTVYDHIKSLMDSSK